MATNNAINSEFTNNADGFSIGGGTTKRTLTHTGADVTLTGSGSNTHTFPSTSQTLVGLTSTDTLTNKTMDFSANTFNGVPSLTEDAASVSGDWYLVWDTVAGALKKIDHDNLPSGGVTDHGALTGLTDDDHSIYALLAGRSSGQTLIGGAAAEADLILQSTSNASKGHIYFGSSGAASTAYKESTGFFGFGISEPVSEASVDGTFSLKEQGASPAGIASWGQIYTKTDAKLYYTNSSGTEFELGAGVGDALVANPLSQFAATTSAQLAGVISDETGSGALVFATSPTLVTPALGTPASGVLTNTTGYPGDSSLTTVGTVTTGNVDAVVSAGTTTTAGKLELATTAEIDAGTGDLALSVNEFNHSIHGAKTVTLLVLDDDTATAVGDKAGSFTWRVPPELDGMDLVKAEANVGVAGTTGTLDIQIHNIDNALDMLTDKIQVASAALNSDDGETINASNDHVNTNDRIRIDIDAIHTTPAQGLQVTMVFRLP